MTIYDLKAGDLVYIEAYQGFHIYECILKFHELDSFHSGYIYGNVFKTFTNDFRISPEYKMFDGDCINWEKTQLLNKLPENHQIDGLAILDI